jgi:hypothetical protein
MLFNRLEETRSRMKALEDLYWLGNVPGGRAILSTLDKKIEAVDRANRRYGELEEEFQQGFKPAKRLNKSELEMAKHQLTELHAIAGGCHEIKKSLAQLNGLIAPDLWRENLKAGGMNSADIDQFLTTMRANYAVGPKEITLDEFLHAAANQGAIAEGEFLRKARESKAGEAVREFMEGKLTRDLLVEPDSVKAENNNLLRNTVMQQALLETGVLIDSLSEMAARNIRYLTNKWPDQLGEYRHLAPARA